MLSKNFKYKFKSHSLNSKWIKIAPLALLMLLTAGVTYSQSVDELKQSIESQNEKIKQLDQEIKAYEREIQIMGGEAKSLQNAVKVLDINQQKINAEIRRTQTNIEKTTLAIKNLSGEIGDAEIKIGKNMEAISNTLNGMREQDEESLIESFLTGKSISDILNKYEIISQFQERISDQTKELESHKDDLSIKKSATEAENKKLLSLKSELGDQHQILAQNKKEKNDLLTATKNKEAEYKKMLSNVQAEKQRAERELFEFESKLKRAIDPASYPKSGKGIFSWPLESIFITQYFGKTADSKRLYVSGTHNGVDFRASRGTPVKAVLDGTVQGIGNTDEQRGCYSYGKWVLVRHSNGLSTLYAHLDLIKVSAGQNVATGEVIGYSGNTGYSTGPHLHLTVYASQGVQVQKYSSSLNCKDVNIPMAPIEAYLDPMLYF